MFPVCELDNKDNGEEKRKIGSDCQRSALGGYISRNANLWMPPLLLVWVDLLEACLGNGRVQGIKVITATEQKDRNGIFNPGLASRLPICTDNVRGWRSATSESATA